MINSSSKSAHLSASDIINWRSTFANRMALETHKKTHKIKYLVYIDLNKSHLNWLIMIKKITSHTQIYGSFLLEVSWHYREVAGVKMQTNQRGQKEGCKAYPREKNNLILKL